MAKLSKAENEVADKIANQIVLGIPPDQIEKGQDAFCDYIIEQIGPLSKEDEAIARMALAEFFA